MQRKILSTIKYIIYLGSIVVLTLPSLILTLYSYPVQDDFHYAYYGRELMRQGYNLITMSFAKTWEYYITFCGCYTSSFLGYFFSAIINCNVWGIRIFELLSAIIFYLAAYAVLRALVIYVMGYSKEKIPPMYILLLLCFNALIHYGEQEDFYWFITSVQYLLITSFIFFGIALFLYALKNRSKKAAVVAAILGFLGSGGALNIAAFCCILYFLSAIWGFCAKREKMMSGIVFGVILVGGLVNGLAPGNYTRAGEPLTISKLFEAMTDSFAYAFSRMEMFLQNPIYVAIIVILVVYLLMCRSNDHNYRFYMPGLFSAAAFCFVAIVIFPVMLGYGKGIYPIICRSNFISDTAIYLFTFLTLFYWRGWIERRFSNFAISDRMENIILLLSIAVLTVIIGRRKWKEVPFVRETREWYNGVYREYSDYCVGVYEQIAGAEGNIAEIVVREVKDTTCMIDPQFYTGYYDPEKEHANRTIARFYGKDAVYIYFEE